MHSAGIIEAAKVWEAIFSNENGGVTVLACDPVEFLAETPRYSLKHR
jgi:hypothetical protein